MATKSARRRRNPPAPQHEQAQTGQCAVCGGTEPLTALYDYVPAAGLLRCRDAGACQQRALLRDTMPVAEQAAPGGLTSADMRHRLSDQGSLAR